MHHKDTWCENVDLIELDDEYSTVQSSCEQVNGPSGYINGDEFLGNLSEWLRRGLTSAYYNQLCVL
jgi:hypothetical protein